MKLLGKSLFTIALTVLLTNIAVSQNSVVVIPMFGDDLKPLKNIVTVAMENGDYATVSDALNSITDASVDNGYLIVVAPGLFEVNQSIDTKPFVNISGSGRGITKIRGEVSSATSTGSSAVITLNSNTILSDLTVENTGGSNFSQAIAILGDTTRVERVSAVATGAVTNQAIVSNAASANFESAPLLIDVVAKATGGNSSTGFYVFDGSPVVRKSRALAEDGVTNTGLYNNSNTGVSFVNSTAFAKGGTSNFGVYNFDSSASPVIRNSYLGGSTASVDFTNSSGTKIVISTIQDTILNDSVSTNCFQNYDLSLNPVSC